MTDTPDPSANAIGRWENEGGALLCPSIRADFPGIGNWHYLDTGATAQKPQVVLDAMMRAGGVDYATVHRGVYARSANMTLAYEAARRRVAAFIGAASDQEIVFVRGATEAINLVANSFPKTGRILLSQLEHHSNIVPWQLAGYEIDVCPLTADGRIDLDAAVAYGDEALRSGIGFPQADLDGLFQVFAFDGRAAETRRSP